MRNKICFKNFWPNFRPEQLGPLFVDNPYLKLNNIEINFVSDLADIIVYGCFGDFLYEAANDSPDAIKVLLVSEPMSADFNFFDYCISYEPYDFGGRNLYYPPFLFEMRCAPKILSPTEARFVLSNKTLFCDFIYSHDGVEVSRKHYLDLFQKYKTVVCAGTYLNNQKDGSIILFSEKDKVQSKCKFSLCIQSVISREYFINEKIIHALLSNEIPIYFGPKVAKEIFNNKRVIFADKYSDDELLKVVVDIDNNPKKYCEMLQQPIFNDEQFYEKNTDNACLFIFEIISGKKNKQLLCKFRQQHIRNEYIEYYNSFNFIHRNKLLNFYYKRKKKYGFRKN